MVDGKVVGPHQIASAVLGNPSYVEGTPINLVTCHGACGLGEELESILGVRVRALPNKVDLDPKTGALRDLGVW